MLSFFLANYQIIDTRRLAKMMENNHIVKSTKELIPTTSLIQFWVSFIEIHFQVIFRETRFEGSQCSNGSFSHFNTYNKLDFTVEG